MATTTTNFGWDIPQSTDLVKDGATAIAALGQDIDTALVDLKGGTTGQILAKASNTDLDYSWITNDVGDITAVTAGTGISGGGTSGAVTVTNSMATAIDAKGDLIGGTGADTFSRLAVGANGTVLTADSAEATGMKWAAAASGGALVFITSSTFTTSSAVNINSCFSSSYQNYRVIVDVTSASASATQLAVKFRASGTDSSSDYYSWGIEPNAGSDTIFVARGANISNGIVGYQGANGTKAGMDVFAPFASTRTFFTTNYSSITAAPLNIVGFSNGCHNVASSYDGISIIAASGTITGTIYVYGYANS
jgi:hypothetical protein